MKAMHSNNSTFISVEEAEKIVLDQVRDYGIEKVNIENAVGRILAEDIVADRDFPPFNRVTMDGIAISYNSIEKGINEFRIKNIQTAGEDPHTVIEPEECIEIMTGASLPFSTDTVISYEEIKINNGIATVETSRITKGQNIHFKGKDKKQNSIVLEKGNVIDAISISIAASVGAIVLSVKKIPNVVVISTGNELVDINTTPSVTQIRQSNNHLVKASLLKYGIDADLLHIDDNSEFIKKQLQHCLRLYDVIIISGGVSMGKFDFIPSSLEELQVQKLFHKVRQRPGKPFWLGTHANRQLVFAFPGNPVSTFLCLNRYFIPWLEKSLGIKKKKIPYAILNENISFNPPLHYFLQVALAFTKEGEIQAIPLEGNGSGDFTNLTESEAFMELPAEQNNFIKGSRLRIWPFKDLI
ncbi:MAG: molybdopterin molybdotransferase MoeA [Flavisolibacter sp.]